MHLGQRKTIAIFVSRITGEYQKVLVNSVTKKAAEYGYYTLVYTAFGNYGASEAFTEGERYVADLPNYEGLNGILLAMDTFEEPGLEQRILELIKKRATCPVVCIRRPIEGYHNVLVDDEHSLEGVMKHLLDDHCFRDLCFVSGPKNHPDAIRRQDCYERQLKQHGIACAMDNIFYGDFWKNKGAEAVEYLLEGRTQLPEAIVCANDYMAISVCDALQKRGIHVPEQIVVTGFDDIEEAEICVPSITTVYVDVERMGECAVDTLQQLMCGFDMPINQYIPTKLVVRESCGCEKHRKERIENVLRDCNTELQLKSHLNKQTIFMSLSAESARDVDSLNKIVYKYIFNNKDFRDFFMVLNDYDWGHEEMESFHGFTNRVRLRTAIQERYHLGHINHVFELQDILPEEYVPETPCAYIIVPMHYNAACYGYCMITYSDLMSVNSFFQCMITNIINTFDSIRIQYKTDVLISKLQEMYVNDSLTGLLNRYGFEENSRELYKKAVQENRCLAIVGIDMDGLKTINDTFGHAHGDIALRALANAITAACFASETCYRVGGDEFEVLALDYSAEMVESFTERLNCFLADYNERSGRPYIVQASVGHVICQPASNHALNEWMTLSDNAMYQVKEQRRSTRKITREINE